MTAEVVPAKVQQKKAVLAPSSARKALQILFAFSEQRHEATVAELAILIDSPVPTVYRHVALLKELQLLEEGQAAKYHPTARVMPLARAAQLSNDMARIAKPVVTEAAELLNETVMLMQYFGDSVVCVERQECDRPMRFTFQPGHSIPLGVGASGRMALASLPEADRTRRISELAGPLESTVDALTAEAEATMRRQYAVSTSEVDDGVWACSVPLTVRKERPVVLTVAGPVSRIDDAAQERALVTLQHSATRIRDEFDKYALCLPPRRRDWPG